MNETATTGISGLDEILRGGLPRDRIYLVQGDPGVGKTTLALHFLLDGIERGESALYVTLSETKEELEQVASAHGWSLAKLALFELSAMEQSAGLESENTIFDPGEVDLREAMQPLLARVDALKPQRVVFDSLSEVRLLAQTPLRYRRQILALKQYFAGKHSTVLLLDDRTSQPEDMQLQSIAHGVVTMEQHAPQYGEDRRRLRVAKLRGRRFSGGYHDFTIRTGGLTVFPRVIAAEHNAPFTRAAVSSGLTELDRLLGGGIDRGTSTLIAGPAGSGKSILSSQLAVSAAARGEHATIFAFEERAATLIARSDALGMKMSEHIAAGRITLHQIDPAEMGPGELACTAKRGVEEGARLIVIDSLNGLLNAMPEERFLTAQMHELLSYFGQKGVSTIMVMAQGGMFGHSNPVDISYLADSVILLRLFEAGGEVRKALSVLKKRSGAHEKTIREMTIDTKGLHIGPPLADFVGVLTGLPTYVGERSSLSER